MLLKQKLLKFKLLFLFFTLFELRGQILFDLDSCVFKLGCCSLGVRQLESAYSLDFLNFLGKLRISLFGLCLVGTCLTKLHKLG